MPAAPEVAMRLAFVRPGSVPVSLCAMLEPAAGGRRCRDVCGCPRLIARAIASRVAVLALSTLFVLAAGCRRPPSVAAAPGLGDFRGIEPTDIDPAFAEDWNALQRAREADPADPEVTRRADALLRRRPPGPLRAAALLVKSEQLYLVGDDARAILAAETGLSSVSVEARPAAAVEVALAVVRVRALVRGGDPEQALAALAERAKSTRLGQADAISSEERLGLTAVALDRAGRAAAAAVAFAQWRGALDEADPAASYAEARLSALSRIASASELARMTDDLAPSAARECLDIRLGRVEASTRARREPWVQRCGRADRRVGVLLARTGPLSALADPQLGAAQAAMEVLGAQSGGRVRWQDAGSTPGDALAGARALIAGGVDVVVGPVGAANVKAVAGALGGGAVEIVVPGEAARGVYGVAPSLEGRIAALLAHARREGASRVVVIAPENAYGRRAVKAAQAAASGGESRTMLVQLYAPTTTSFAPVLAPLLPALRPGVAVLIPDLVSRVELVLRQLARLGKATAGEREGLIVLSTAEGLDARSMGPGHEVLEHVRVAPAANRTPRSAAFEATYAARQGEPPGDQALLVYYALRRALLGEEPPEQPSIVRVRGGRLVGQGPRAD